VAFSSSREDCSGSLRFSPFPRTIAGNSRINPIENESAGCKFHTEVGERPPKTFSQRMLQGAMDGDSGNSSDNLDCDRAGNRGAGDGGM
jgi:hypothetical protein